LKKPLLLLKILLLGLTLHLNFCQMSCQTLLPLVTHSGNAHHESDAESQATPNNNMPGFPKNSGSYAQNPQFSNGNV